MQGNSDVEILKITNASRAIDYQNLLVLANLKVLWLCSVVVLGYEQFGQLRALKSLTISYYIGYSIPDSLGQLSALESLIVANCLLLIALPSTLGQLKALRRLQVIRCASLTALPGTVGELRGLRLLRIVSCPSLESLPEALGKCQALDHLEISGCLRLNDLSLTTMEFPALRHFEIEWVRGQFPGRELRRNWEPLEGMLRKFRPLQLQHLTVCVEEDSRIVKERLQELDALKHLEVWIHDDVRTYHIVGERELSKKRNSLEILYFSRLSIYSHLLELHGSLYSHLLELHRSLAI